MKETAIPVECQVSRVSSQVPSDEDWTSVGGDCKVGCTRLKTDDAVERGLENIQSVY